MNYLFLGCLLLSHGLSALPFIRKIQCGQTLSIVDFTPLSIFLYYDVGIALEVFGLRYDNYFFSPFLSKPNVWTSAIFFIMLSAPWLFRLGAMLSTSAFKSTNTQEELLSYLRPDRSGAFYILSALLCLICASGGLYLVISYPVIWIARRQVSDVLGPYTIVLYLPLFVLAYYIQQRRINPTVRNLFLLFLVACSILSTLPVGERTNALLPFLIVTLFYKRLNVRSLAVAGLIGATAAALLVPLFKAGEADGQDIETLIAGSLNSDFSRSQLLVYVVDQSPMIGTNVMPYSGSGYVYSLLFFVPRVLVPFKGVSTAVEYTSEVTGTPTLDTNWGFGIGVIEEIILNFGLVALIPGLILCGVILRLLDTLSDAVPASGVGLRLAAIWLCGYHLPALLLEFGTMVIVAIVLSRIFSMKDGRSCTHE